MSLFLGPAAGLHSHSLLLDEERGRLLLGARDHVYLLDPDNLAKAPRKVKFLKTGMSKLHREGGRMTQVYKETALGFVSIWAI